MEYPASGWDTEVDDAEKRGQACVSGCKYHAEEFGFYYLEITVLVLGHVWCQRED